jgi:MFS transporter, AAHS family, 4-hydroxybenzoate transporter
MSRRIDVSEVIEKQSARGFLLMLLVLLGAASLLEGFDAQIQGYTAPAITKLWHIPRASFGPVFSSFQLGILFGAALLGNLGDIFGRRLMIIGGILLFGVFTVAGGLCGDVTMLAATRFASGLFLGCATANVIALVIDYSKHGKRGFNIGLMYVLYTVGGSGGGFLSAWCVPHYGWHSVYFICGFLAMALAVLQLLLLPESARFMAVRHRYRARLLATMRRLSPHLKIEADTEFYLQHVTAKRAWVGELFTERRAVMTSALWLAYFFGLMAIIFVTSWMPTVFADSGFSYESSVITVSLFQFGGAIGSVFFGWILDRKNGILWVALICLVGVPVIAGIGHATFWQALLMTLVFLAGVCVVGTQTVLNALGGGLYPSTLRASGAGWASGMGRIGGILGPLLGSILIALHLPLALIFLLVSMPSLCVAGLLVVVHFSRPGSRAGEGSPQPGRASNTDGNFARALESGD